MSDEVTIGGVIKTVIISLVVAGAIIGAIIGIRQLAISNARWEAAHPVPPDPQVWTVYKHYGLGIEYFKVYDPNKLQKSGDCISGTDVKGQFDHMCGDYTIKEGDESDL